MFLFKNPAKLTIPSPADALPGRTSPIPTSDRHVVNGRPLAGPYPDGTEIIDFAFGCFWGAEKDFWETPGVWVTAVGYQGGHTPNPTYEEVCSGRTGHAESVRVVFDPARVSLETILRTFWENHDPSQGMRQGNDVGTQYRSAIFWHTDEQRHAAEASRDSFAKALAAAGRRDAITTEIAEAPAFYFAEDYHQQYLAKNPRGYCPNHATGVQLPDDFAVTPLQYVD
jgi:peptide-methionine (S)-S-oxide reductase